jgi:hypothetical protein
MESLLFVSTGQAISSMNDIEASELGDSKMEPKVSPPFNVHLASDTSWYISTSTLSNVLHSLSNLNFHMDRLRFRQLVVSY